MGSSSWSGGRMAGLAGIGFTVVLVVLLGLGDGPVYSDSAAEVREFFVESDLQVHLTTWLAAFAFILLLVPFATGLQNLLASTDDDAAALLSRLSYTGAVIAAAVGLAGTTFWEVLSQGTAEELPDSSLVAQARFDTVVFIGVLPWATALFAGSASALILRTGVLARWLGWLGSTSAVLLIAGTLWIFTEDDESALAVLGYIGLPVMALWVLLTGIAMLRRPATDRPDRAQPQAGALTRT